MNTREYQEVGYRKGRVTVKDWKEDIRDTTPRKTHIQGETCGRQRRKTGDDSPGWHVKVRLKRFRSRSADAVAVATNPTPAERRNTWE